MNASSKHGAGAVVENARVPHPTVVERTERGRAAREEAPRSGQAELAPGAGRDPVAVLEAQAAARVPELVPIRHGRMLASPFAFFRGAAAVMAADLAQLPRTGLTVQLCGDAHLANFGGYASPERRLVFDLNDFDETLPGPFEWDVKRLAASFEVAGRARGFSEGRRAAAVRELLGSYRTAMRQFAGMRALDVWYARLDADALDEELRREHAATQARRLEQAIEHARSRDSLRAFAKLTVEVDGEPRIVSDPPLIVPLRELAGERQPDDLEQSIRMIFRTYRRTLQGDRRRLLEQFRYADLARKVVGVGSVGTRCFVMLLLGRDGGDPLFLQVKEAQESVLEPHLGRSPYSNHGQRVVEGQRLMQATSDIFLGWTANQGGLDGVERDFTVRQLWDWKTSVDLDRILPRGLVLYARICGWTLARAHARSGDCVAIAEYLGKGTAFDDAVGEFARRYADLNERDHAAFAEAVGDGRLQALEGV